MIKHIVHKNYIKTQTHLLFYVKKITKFLLNINNIINKKNKYKKGLFI